MKKRLLLIALVIVLSTGTVVQTEMHAEAAATTVTAVTVAKAILVLLAIAGVGIASGYAWENGEQIKEEAVASFTTWLQNHDPDYYLALMLAATNITAGRVINTYDALFFGKLKQYTREYFGTDTSVSTTVGTASFSIRQLSISASDTSYYATFSNGTTRYFHGLINYYVIPTVIYDTQGNEVLFFIPTVADSSIVGSSGSGSIAQVLDSGTSVSGLNYGQVTNRSTRYWKGLVGSNFSVFNSNVTIENEYAYKSAIQSVLTNYYNGQYSTITEDVVMRPFTTIGNVAATSVDATVVGAGQTIAEDEENEIVIDGDRTINLSNVNIDEWLKSLSEGVTSYADAMEQIGLAAVNTQTMTLEEVQAIAQALNPAAAGTGTITGNYTVALSDLFPFCIPFDLYNIISCFKADPVAPSAEITIPVGYDGSEFTWETYTVSLSAFDAVAAVVRVLEYIGFVIGLMLITRKLIEG